MKKTLFIILGLVLAGSLFGLTYTQTQNFSGVPNYTRNLTFNKYNAGNTLLSVRIITYLEVDGGYYAVDNDSEDPASGDITLTSEAWYPSGQLDNNATAVRDIPYLTVLQGDSFNLTSTTGDATNVYNDTGLGDHFRFDGEFNTRTSDEFLDETAPIFTGSDTFTIQLRTSHANDHGGVSGIYFSGGPISAEGYVQIIYTDDTPLPVELSTFTATFTNQELILRWITQSETNNSHWNIYRSEFEDYSQAYQVNGTPVEGQGTISEPTTYIYHDTNSSLPETTYWYWLENVDYSGESSLHGPASVTTPQLDNPEPPQTPDVYGLKANYPNPFNPSTMIQFLLKETEPVELTVYNIMGRKVKTLHQGVVNADVMTSVVWDGTDDNAKSVSSGLYFYKLVTPTRTEAKKMLLVK